MSAQKGRLCLSEQFGSILGVKVFDLLNKFGLSLFIELRRRRRAGRDWRSNLYKEILLPRRGTDAEQPSRLGRNVVELMWGVGRNVYGIAGSNLGRCRSR